MRKTSYLLRIILFASALPLLQTEAAPPDHALEQRVKPILDIPLRDPAICRGPDNIYYLTGTAATIGEEGEPDFANNDGVYLWRSKNRQDWQPLGGHGAVFRDKDGNGWPPCLETTKQLPSAPNSESIHCISNGLETT